jgi:hypothetical protein
MNVTIQPGQVAVPSQNNTGSTLCTSDAVEQITIPAAPTAPNNRIDLVICRPRGADLDGGANNDFMFDSVQGSAAATPTVPAAPAGTVALASIYLAGGAATIVAGNITDLRPGGLSVPGTASLPPPVTTGSVIQTFTDPAGEVWVARNGVNGGNWRKARDVLHAQYWRSLAFSLPTTASLINMDTMIRDPYTIYASGTGILTAPVAGVYLMRVSLGAANPVPTGASFALSIQNQAGTTVNQVSVGTAQAFSQQINTTAVEYLNAGDTLRAFGSCTTAATGGPGRSVTNLAADFLGTG